MKRIFSTVILTLFFTYVNNLNMGIVIGIDLGTTNSVAAYMGPNGPQLLPGPHGERIFPSLVAFVKSGEILVGDPAKSQIVLNPNTIYSVKRLMGKKYSEVEPYLDQFSYSIVDDGTGRVNIKVGENRYSPEEISAMILRSLKESAEKELKEEISGAIITVPAYFNDSQRQATRDAGEIAGLNVLRIINEPTAASLAFSLKLKGNAKVLVYDFGGGTIDISVLEVSNDVIKVLATAGDIKIGGDDFDIRLTERFLKKIEDESEIDIRDNKLAVQRLRDEAEKAKKMLSQLDYYEINLPFLAEKDNEPINFSNVIKRKDFEELISDTVEKTISICTDALKACKLDKSDVDEILLVGGTTRIPYVQKRLEEFFEKNPNKRVNPDEIVAMGAAVQGSISSGKTEEVLLVDVIPISLGVKTHGESFAKIIEANSAIPISKTMVFTTATDEQSEVEVDVFQGESKKVENNVMLGTFILGGINPAPTGEPRIEVKFEIDVNGILKVSAVDLSSGKSNEITIVHSGLLSRGEIDDLKEKNISPAKEKETKPKKKSKVREKSIDKPAEKKAKKRKEKSDTKEKKVPISKIGEAAELKLEIMKIADFIEECRKNPNMKDMESECGRLIKRINRELDSNDVDTLKDLKFELDNIKEDLKILSEIGEGKRGFETTTGFKKKKDDTNPFLKISDEKKKINNKE